MEENRTAFGRVREGRIELLRHGDVPVGLECSIIEVSIEGSPIWAGTRSLRIVRIGQISAELEPFKMDVILSIPIS